MKNIGLVFDSKHSLGGGHFWRCFNLANMLKRKDRKLANKLFNFLFMIFIGGNFTDICSGYRFLKKDSFNKLEIKSKNFEIETEISVYSVFNKLKTLEVDIDYKERINSQSKLKTFSDSYSILKFLIKKSLRSKY